MTIIVTGSLGHISRPLTETLIQNGHQVTVISSNSDRQADIEALGAKAAIGSVDDADFLTATFTGADAVYAMIPPNYTTPDSTAYYQKIGDSYAGAIRQAGVKRVVHLSSWGADKESGTGFIVGSHRVEQTLNQLTGVAVTHLRAGYIYYNMLRFVDMIKGSGRIMSNYGGDDKIVMVAPVDIAAAAADELQTPATPGTHIRYVASDDRSVAEITPILGAAIGKPDLQWIHLTDEQMKGGMERNHLPAHVIENSIALGASIHNGTLREDYDRQHPHKMGLVKLEDYAKEFEAAYQKG